ncbi:hypothetical protein Tco_1559592, partial [Tanacetum coccineum]
KDIGIPQSSGPTEHIADEVANEERVPTQSNDPPLSRVNTLGKTTKTAQAKEIAILKKRVKKLERKRKSKPPGMKRLFKIGRSTGVVSSEDEEITLVDETQGRYDDNLMFDTDILDNEQDMAEKEVDMAEKDVSTADPVTTVGEVVTTTTTTVDELTLAQTLIEIKAAKPKAITTAVTRPKAREAKDKGKAKMVEPEKPLKKKDQILIDNVQAMMDAYYKLAARLQAQEQEELTIEERSKMFVELMDKRKKHFMLFNKAMTRVNTFVDMDTELVKDSETRTEETSKKLKSKNLKKQKLDENVKAKVDDEAEMKKHME